MDNTIKEIKISKAVTLFMLPFYYEKNTFEINTKPECPIWCHEQKKMGGDDGEFLFPYIMNFLQGQMEDCALDMDYLNVYCLDENTDFYRKYWNKFAPALHVAEIELGKRVKQLKFKFQTSGSKGFVLPHLFVYEAANIGILTFSLSLEDENLDVDNLVAFNYHLHKLFGQVSKCKTPSFRLSETESEKVKRFKESDLRFSREMIGEHTQNKKEMQTEWTPYLEFTWNIKTLKEMFLGSVANGDVVLFIPPRAHLFTFVQVDDAQCDCLKLHDVAPFIVRLSRCITDKYQLPFEELEGEDCILRTFKNIYMSASVEGTAMIAIAKSENQGFISSMDGNSLPRYLWIYILTLIQRYTLLNMERRLTAIEMNKYEDKKDVNEGKEKDQEEKEKYSKELWELIRVINKVQVNCHFIEVSPFTQHNQFYTYCCNSLHLPENYDAVERKMQKMELLVNHDIQEILSLQQKQQERESEKRKVMEHRLTVFISILTLFQGVVAFKDIIFAESFISKDVTRDYATLCVFILALISMLIYTNCSSNK